MPKSSSARVARSSKAIVVAAFVGFACSVNAAIVGSTGGTFIPPGSWGGYYEFGGYAIAAPNSSNDYFVFSGFSVRCLIYGGGGAFFCAPGYAPTSDNKTAVSTGRLVVEQCPATLQVSGNGEAYRHSGDTDFFNANPSSYAFSSCWGGSS